jgi:hypothetical protein
VATQVSFTGEDVWHGSFYELAMELGEHPEERIEAAATALWSHPSLDGPYADRSREPDAQPKVPPSLVVDADMNHGYGLATLPDGNRLPCLSVVVRESSDGGSDWLDLCFPTGALCEVYDLYGSAPDYVDPSWRPWAEPLDLWFAEIARTVYRETPFRLGLIGEEVSGMFCALDLAAKGIANEPMRPLLVPDEDGSLLWYPATEW